MWKTMLHPKPMSFEASEALREEWTKIRGYIPGLV